VEAYEHFDGVIRALERPRPEAEVLLPYESAARVTDFFEAHGSRAQVFGGHSIPFALHE
jgi:hypothetical protein